MTEDEMVGWHHLFNEHELGQTRGDNEGQGNLVCYSPWGHKESALGVGFWQSRKRSLMSPCPAFMPSCQWGYHPHSFIRGAWETVGKTSSLGPP